MKINYKGLLLLLAVALFCAFQPAPAQHQKEATVFDWHQFNWEGNAEIYPTVIFTGTEDEAEGAFECYPIGGKLCARAYLGGYPTDYYLTKYY